MSVTGPFTKVSYATDYVYKYQKWYRQSVPYVLPLAYDMIHRVKTYDWDGTSGSASNASFVLTDMDPAYPLAYQKAYSKLVESLSSTAANAVNLAERKQAIDSITKRFGQTFRFAKAVKSLNFLEAGRVLGLTTVFSRGQTIRFKTPKLSSKEGRRMMRNPNLVKSRKMVLHRDSRISWELHLKRNIKDFGSNYLEYHFGWEPLLQDIHANIKILTDPMMAGIGKKVSGSGSNTQPAGSYPLYMYNVKSFYPAVWSGVKLGAYFKIENPNVVKAGQLGLVNPAVLAWELVPFSFVVDWFSNVGQYLSSYTDFLGYTITGGYESRFVSAMEKAYYRRPEGNLLLYDMKHTSVKRTPVSNFGPSLVWRPPKLPSVTRALTAVSLLTALLSSH